MVISNEFKEKITLLLREFLQTDIFFRNNHQLYLAEIQKANLILTTINAPRHLTVIMEEKRKRGVHCFYQLHYSERSYKLMTAILDVVQKSNNIPCIPFELKSLMEETLYEYLNNDLDRFIDINDEHGDQWAFLFDEVKNILNKKNSFFKKIFQYIHLDSR